MRCRRRRPSRIAKPVLENDRLIKLSEVCELTGLGKTMIYRLVRPGMFPQQYKPGGASSRWSAAEVQAWIAEVKARRATSGPSPRAIASSDAES